MNRITYIEIAGKSYPMSFSLAASKKIVEKFGSAEKMKSAMDKANDVKKIDLIVEMLALLTSQGCAYKNYFEKDVPAPENAPIIDGKWTPLPADVIEIALGVMDMKDVSEKIKECMDIGSKKEVEAKPEEKNVDAAHQK